jgi:hypothetical protein
MKKLILIIFCALFITSCAHKIAVVTLESTINQAATAAKKAAGNAAGKLTIEVSVVNGYKGSATLPVPVVPIGAETSLTQSTKLTLEINLNNFTIKSDDKSNIVATPAVYYLDKNSGLLTETQ